MSGHPTSPSQPTYAHTPPQGPGPAQPAGKPKKPFFKRVWVWIAIVVVVLIGLSAVGGGGTDTAPPAGDPAAGGDAGGQSDAGGEKGDGGGEKSDGGGQEAPAGLNTPVLAGDVEYTITAWECGVEMESPLAEDPQGQYCKMQLTAKNTGSKAVDLSSSFIKVGDGSAEYESTISYNDDAIIYEKINPGNTLTGTVYFDVPEASTPTVALLQGDIFGKTVEVSLS